MTASRYVPERNSRGKTDAAFTLIELLVVVGLIALLTGALGLALRGGRSSAALQSAQGLVASLCETARGRAALANRPSAIAVEASGAGGLRTLHVVVQDGGNWQFAGEPVSLAGECYLVPGTASPADVSLATGWPLARKSTFGGEVSVTDAAGNSVRCYLSLFQFSSDGKFTSSGIPDRLVLATARRSSATELSFENPEFVRGVVLSAYGASILINEAEGF